VFPSITFPNHYSIVTGLYPENHGIVGNNFYDPAQRRRFVYTDRSTSADGSWYAGVPLWALAERQGMRAACFFWPGAEAEIGGMRPTYNVPYDPRIPNERRIDQVVDWLRLPPETRPHFITLYFGDVDSAGHSTGTDSPETARAVRRIDGLIARLNAAVALLGLPVAFGIGQKDFEPAAVVGALVGAAFFMWGSGVLDDWLKWAAGEETQDVPMLGINLTGFESSEGPL